MDFREVVTMLGINLRFFNCLCNSVGLFQEIERGGMVPKGICEGFHLPGLSVCFSMCLWFYCVMF